MDAPNKIYVEVCEDGIFAFPKPPFYESVEYIRADFVEQPLQQEKSEKSKKDCNNCPHCIDRKDQIGWHFRGCFGGQYKGKPIAEIEECPLQQEQPNVDLEKEIDSEWKKCEPIDEGMGLESANIVNEQFDHIAHHFYELGLKAKKK